MTPAVQAIQLHRKARKDHAEFNRAHGIAPAHATQIFTEQCLFLQLHGLWLLTMTMRLDMLDEEIDPTISIQSELLIHHHG